VVYHVLIFCMIAAIGLLAGVDTAQEDQHEILGLVIPLAVLGPVLSFFWLWPRSGLTAQIVYFFILAVGLAIYIFYVLSGHSDPNTAGHMHTILFPILYIIFSVGLSLGFSAVQLKLSLRNPSPQNRNSID